MNIIDSFLNRYAKEYDFYHQLARQVAAMCEMMLQRNGIRGIVSYRAKKPYSLREKLDKRNQAKKYQTIDHIYRDIVDLAGVRIAIYFPGDREEIGKLIEKEFIMEKTKNFPNEDQKSHIYDIYKRRFTGYDATHYRVRINEERLDESLRRFAEARVEIQVASALMHSWAEVEHDLVYKPKIGSLSEDEFRILDELNGLVLSGEIALERLQKAFRDRIALMEQPFNNHYELAAMIRDHVNQDSPFRFYMGRVDILLRFLQKADIDNPREVDLYLGRFDKSTRQTSIVDRLVDLILCDYPEYYEKYLEAKFEMQTYGPYVSNGERYFSLSDHEALAHFMTRWIALQKILDTAARCAAIREFSLSSVANYVEELKKLLPFAERDEDMLVELRYLFSLRDTIVFGDEIPSDEELHNASKAVERILRRMHIDVCGENAAVINQSDASSALEA